MKIHVIGCGRWGSFICHYLSTMGHEMTLHGRESSAHTAEFFRTRRNEYLTLSDSVVTEFGYKSLPEADVLVISISSQKLRSLLTELKEIPFRAPLVLCMKGLEEGSHKRLSEVASEVLPDHKNAVWIGPGHVQDFLRGVPNCMVIDSEDTALQDRLIRAFSSPLIRFYYGEDLIGNEIGAASKNVIGLAAGMLDGFDLGTLKGALMSRGTREISRLIEALGGHPSSAYGLCHLGDYEATLFSRHSHNRGYGEAFVKGEPFPSLAEGVATVKALHLLAKETGVELPISETVYSVLHEGLDPREGLDRLFMRSLKKELR